VLVDFVAVFGEHLQYSIDRAVGKRAGGVDAFAEARHLRAARELAHGAAVAVDVGDEQSRRVGSDVDYGDVHGRDARWCAATGVLGGSSLAARVAALDLC
jgi:hypothetical protein